jgi:hypothetical protein
MLIKIQSTLSFNPLSLLVGSTWVATWPPTGAESPLRTEYTGTILIFAVIILSKIQIYKGVVDLQKKQEMSRIFKKFMNENTKILKVHYTTQP